MHSDNPHRAPYDFDALQTVNPSLRPFILLNERGKQTIDFAKSASVFELNKALLLFHYRLRDYSLPKGYLCPAVPSRAEYICQVKSLLDERGDASQKNRIRALDIGTGANCIYPIIAAQHFGWEVVGVDINEHSVLSAKSIVSQTPSLKEKVEIRQQKNNAHIYKDAILDDEHFDVTLCNPPFHASEEEATRATLRKLANLSSKTKYIEELQKNFGGKSNELWCNGGEALFIKRMIKESVAYKKKVSVFTSLVAKKETLVKPLKQLKKLGASHRVVDMRVGQKQSRLLAWWF